VRGCEEQVYSLLFFYMADRAKGEDKRLKYSDIVRYYDNNLFLPALKELDASVWGLIKEFEKKHNCAVIIEHPKVIDRDNPKLFFLSHCRAGSSAYNRGLELMGLDPEKYPPRLTG
jgi:hypothetical protein